MFPLIELCGTCRHTKKKTRQSAATTTQQLQVMPPACVCTCVGCCAQTQFPRALNHVAVIAGERCVHRSWSLCGHCIDVAAWSQLAVVLSLCCPGDANWVGGRISRTTTDGNKPHCNNQPRIFTNRVKVLAATTTTKWQHYQPSHNQVARK